MVKQISYEDLMKNIKLYPQIYDEKTNDYWNKQLEKQCVEGDSKLFKSRTGTHYHITDDLDPETYVILYLNSVRKRYHCLGANNSFNA